MEKLFFKPETTKFKQELFSKVNAYFKENNITIYANKAMKIKIATMITIYFCVYMSLFKLGNNSTYLYLLYAFLGGWSVLLGLNIGHDAAHNAIFKNKKANSILLYVFDILGTNSYNWANRHLGAHHLYPNVMNYDSDVQQTNIVKIFPKDKHKSYHKFQYLYMPFIYLLYIFRWVVYRDFKDVTSKRIGWFKNSNYPNSEIIKMVIFKLLYIFQMIVLPALFIDVKLIIILSAFFILTLFGSLIIILVLLSTHVGEDANFPEPDENNVMPHSWSYHQVLTASDFSTNNTSINFLFGGFNHHVIHHLFPNICHIHYPKLTPILKELALKYGVPYRCEKYLIVAVFSHFKLLKRNAKNQKIL